jgi:NAD-dependent deacetylase
MSREGGIFSERLLAKLRQADAVAVFTGAGISAESGVPTFRGSEGLWKKFKPEELATFDAFVRNPEIVWEWYSYRKELISSVRPNRGHEAIAEMEKRHRNFSVITQNIDNLHRRAGSRNVFELHGNIERNYCIGCGKYCTNEEIAAQAKAPRCASCGNLVRPDVVWFGEMLPAEEWNKSVRAAERSEVFLAVGTSAAVYPAASLPQIARRGGAYVVEVNVEPTEISRAVDETILGKAGEILPALVESYRTEHHAS